jgi:hypothetical protein
LEDIIDECEFSLFKILFKLIDQQKYLKNNCLRVKGRCATSPPDLLLSSFRQELFRIWSDEDFSFLCGGKFSPSVFVPFSSNLPNFLFPAYPGAPRAGQGSRSKDNQMTLSP